MKIPSLVILNLVLGILVLPGAVQPDRAGIMQAARDQIGKTVGYEPGYRALNYPNGDVPIVAGVCTDVVIRALRVGLGLDLQRQVHEDMKRSFPSYPQIWGLKGPDRNIDHRRGPNLQTFFQRSGWALPVTKVARDYRAGDLVTCIVPPNLPHIMIVSDQTTLHQGLRSFSALTTSRFRRKGSMLSTSS